MSNSYSYIFSRATTPYNSTAPNESTTADMKVRRRLAFARRHQQTLGLQPNAFLQSPPSPNIFYHPENKKSRQHPFINRLFKDSHTFIGRGIQGMTFVVRTGPQFDRMVAGLAHKIGRKPNLPPGTPVLLKVMCVPVFAKFLPADTQHEMWRYVAAYGQHEARILRHLQSVVPENHLFPKLYVAGANLEHGTYVVAMKFFDLHTTFWRWSGQGATASATVRMPYFTALMEKALLLMWYAGIIHTDLHQNNILVGNDEDSLVLIDFGMAVCLPRSERAEARRKLGPVIAKLRRGEDVDMQKVLASVEPVLSRHMDKGGRRSNSMPLRNIYRYWKLNNSSLGAVRRLVWWQPPKTRSKRPRNET